MNETDNEIKCQFILRIWNLMKFVIIITHDTNETSQCRDPK